MMARVCKAFLFGSLLAAIGAGCSRTQIEFGLYGEAAGAAGLDTGGFGGNGPGGASGAGGLPQTGGSGGASFCDELPTSCQQCGCESCPEQWASCVADSGCRAIVDCADANGCGGPECYLGPCRQVIDQNGGPFGQPAALAQTLGSCRNSAGCPCPGGTGGSPGTGGAAGAGGSPGGGGSSGGSGGSGGTGPIACFTCITQQCPSAAECLFDTACRDGAICAVSQCLGGGLDFQCLIGCFQGDFTAALKAFQAFQCLFSQCAGPCAGGIPGFPGLPGVGGGGG
jgi:hypothetical protein